MAPYTIFFFANISVDECIGFASYHAVRPRVDDLATKHRKSLEKMASSFLLGILEFLRNQTDQNQTKRADMKGPPFFSGLSFSRLLLLVVFWPQMPLSLPNTGMQNVTRFCQLLNGMRCERDLHVWLLFLLMRQAGGAWPKLYQNPCAVGWNRANVEFPTRTSLAPRMWSDFNMVYGFH